MLRATPSVRGTRRVAPPSDVARPSPVDGAVDSASLHPAYAGAGCSRPQMCYTSLHVMSEPKEQPDVLPVSRSKREARSWYDRISRIYGPLTGMFERRFALMALDRLAVRSGESVLEVGYGSGHSLELIARSVGESGTACGIDISTGMLDVAMRRVEKAGLQGRVHFAIGDAANLPYRDGSFDAVFMAHTLELFDTPEMPAVLDEVRRVLKPGGRVGIASLSKKGGNSLMLRLYEWAHRMWPKYVDCRPIYVESAVSAAGFVIQSSQRAGLFGLPEEIVVGVRPA